MAKFSKHKSEILKYSILKRVSQAALIITLIALTGIILFVLIRGLPYDNWGQLLFGEHSRRNPSIKPALIGTLYLILIALVIAVPVGVATAIFLVEYTKSKSRIVKYIRISVETLAGIPSIVYGLFGYLVFVVAFGFGYSLLGGGITLAIMILPVLVRSTEESLLSVPRSLREGSFALGASKVRTIFNVVLPSAMGGIVTSIILAVGRIISESAVLILTIGMVIGDLPKSFMSPGTTLALDIYYFGSHGHPEAAAATAAVLIVLVVSLNILATLLGKKLSKSKGND